MVAEERRSRVECPPDFRRNLRGALLAVINAAVCSYLWVREDLAWCSCKSSARREITDGLNDLHRTNSAFDLAATGYRVVKGFSMSLPTCSQLALAIGQ